MAIRTITQLKSWFVRGACPTAAQFADWMDSYVHKSDKIAMSDVTGLTSALNSKAEATDVEAAASAAASAQQSATSAHDAFNEIGAIEIEDINGLFVED